MSYLGLMFESKSESLTTDVLEYRPWSPLHCHRYNYEMSYIICFWFFVGLNAVFKQYYSPVTAGS